MQAFVGHCLTQFRMTQNGKKLQKIQTTAQHLQNRENKTTKKLHKTLKETYNTWKTYLKQKFKKLQATAQHAKQLQRTTITLQNMYKATQKNSTEIQTTWTYYHKLQKNYKTLKQAQITSNDYKKLQTMKTLQNNFDQL